MHSALNPRFTVQETEANRHGSNRYCVSLCPSANGQGTTTEPASYQWTDVSYPPNASQLRYRLKQIDFDGAFSYSDVVEVTLAPPEDFSLSGNYPNPFNPTTTIHFSLPVDARISLVVYDMLDREVARLTDGYHSAGFHEVIFDRYGLGSGIYLYRLNTPHGAFERKMLLMK